MYCTRIMQLFVSHGSCRLQFEKISTFEPLIYILLFLYILSAEDYNLKCLCWKGVTLIPGRDCPVGGVSFVIKYMLFVVKSLFNFCFTINDRHFITNNTFPRDDPENGHKYFLCWKYQ